MTMGFSNTQDLDGVALRLITRDGYVRTLNEQQASNLMDRREGASHAHGLLLNRLAEHKIYPDVSAITQDGGLIVRCTGREAEAMLDAAFDVPALARGIKRIPSVSSEVKDGLRTMMAGAFDKAVAGRIFTPALKPNFGMAAMMPRPANYNAPALIAA